MKMIRVSLFLISLCLLNFARADGPSPGVAFEDLVASTKESKEKEKAAQDQLDEFNSGKGDGKSRGQLSYSDKQVKGLDIPTLDFKIPDNLDRDDQGYVSSGIDAVKAECCGIVGQASCHPMLKCLKRFSEGDGLESHGCDRKWFLARRGADACDHLKRVIKKYEKELGEKIAAQKKIVQEEQRAQAAFKKKVEDFIKKETQNDPLSLAAMTGEIALLKMADGKDFSDIKKQDKVGKKLASSLEGSILSEYLTKKVREKLGIGIDRYSPPVSDLLNMCDNLEVNGSLCGEQSTAVSQDASNPSDGLILRGSPKGSKPQSVDSK